VLNATPNLLKAVLLLNLALVIIAFLALIKCILLLMMMSQVPKIIKMEKQYHGIVALCDILLSKGLSLREIALQLRKKYACSISHESIRQYQIFKQTGLVKETEEPELYYRIARFNKRR
jgi:hypothetical protein